MTRAFSEFSFFHSVNHLYNWMTMIDICLLWQVIQMHKINSKDYFIFVDIH